MLSFFGLFLVGGANVQGRSGGYSICLCRRWWQFALGRVVAIERLRYFQKYHYLVKKSKSPGDGLNRYCIRSLYWRTDSSGIWGTLGWYKFSILKNHPRIISQCPGVKSLGYSLTGLSAQGLSRLYSTCWLSCGFIRGSTGERSTFRVSQVVGRIHLLVVVALSTPLFWRSTPQFKKLSIDKYDSFLKASKGVSHFNLEDGVLYNII